MAEEAAELVQLDDHQQPHKSEGISVPEGGGGEVSVRQCIFLRTVRILCFERRLALGEKTSVSRQVRRKVMKATPEWEQMRSGMWIPAGLGAAGGLNGGDKKGNVN